MFTQSNRRDMSIKYVGMIQSYWVLIVNSEYNAGICVGNLNSVNLESSMRSARGQCNDDNFIFYTPMVNYIVLLHLLCNNYPEYGISASANSVN